MRRAYLALPVAMTLLEAPAFAQDASGGQDIGEILGQVLERVLTDAAGVPQPAPTPAPSSSPPPPDSPGSADPLAEAAEEFVTQTMPFDADRREVVEGGQIWPSCFAEYPNVEVIVGQQGHGMDAAETQAMR